MAHYQLSYGFNSNDNSTVNLNDTSTNALKTNSIEAKSVENQCESSLNASDEKNESEKRKLPQPSEPSK